jgi:hypothetical protein
MNTSDYPTTADQWCKFIYCVLYGDLDESLEALGTPSEILLVALRDSPSQSEARATFERALNRVISLWHPEITMDIDVAEGYLAVISAFTPQAGLTKILGQFQLSPSWLVHDITGSGDGTHLRDISARALMSIEPFFLVPPADYLRDQYEIYISLLMSHLRSPLLAPYSIRRLVELRVVQIDSPEFLTALQSNPAGVILETLRTIVVNQTLGRSSSLSSLYAQAAEHQYLDSFEQIASHLGCHLLHGDQGPMLSTPFGDIDVFVSGVAQDRYMDRRWQAGGDYSRVLHE